MNDETAIIPKPTAAPVPALLTSAPTNEKPNSSIFGVSIRGWLAVAVIVTVCAMGLIDRTVQEPLYTLSVAIVSFYYGQNIKKT